MNRSHYFSVVFVAMGLVCSVISATATASPILFSDDFEAYTSVSPVWADSSDSDPTTPPIGQAWTVVEASAPRVQVTDHVQNLTNTLPSFAAADGVQNLHLVKTAGGGQGQAWITLSSADQAQIAATGAVHITAKIFALSGYDGWNGNVSVSAFDSSVGAFTNMAFDVNALDGGYGVNGVVATSSNRSTFTATTLADHVDVWQNLSIDVDFIAHTYSITLDGNTLGSLPLVTSGLTKITTLMLAAGDITVGGETSFRGGFDDVVVSVPEPASVGLFVLGGFMLVRRRRAGN